MDMMLDSLINNSSHSFRMAGTHCKKADEPFRPATSPITLRPMMSVIADIDNSQNLQAHGG
jgi:hypothetical protein